ncbi:MAG: lipocalin family protein [Gammaproteobacteria bacterium]
MLRHLPRFGLALSLTALAGCGSLSRPPLATVERVDLERFMGDWYVIANIPTFIERGAHNAVESYRLDADGSIATTFTFRRGGFDGERAEYTPLGYVTDTESNAIWGMQFIWPIKADFRITYLDADYTVTAIGRQKRDYVWIMARTPQIPEARYRDVLDHLAAQGYDISRIEPVPQRWPEAQP